MTLQRAIQMEELLQEHLSKIYLILGFARFAELPRAISSLSVRFTVNLNKAAARMRLLCFVL